MSEIKEKVGILKRTWKYIVTGVTCAAVGAGVTIGADVAKVQETITKSEANQLLIQAATYSAEQVLEKVTTIATSSQKAEAIKEAVDATKAAIPVIKEGVAAAKDSANNAKESVQEGIDKAKEEANKDKEAKTETAKQTKVEETKTTVQTKK